MPALGGAEHDPPTMPCRVVANRAQAEAIWALADAMDRLGAVIAGSGGSIDRRSSGRHGTDRDRDRDLSVRPDSPGGF
jgi:hypothetical protein